MATNDNSSAVDKYFVLNKYMLSLFGVNSFADIQSVFKNLNVDNLDNAGCIKKYEDLLNVHFGDKFQSNILGSHLSFFDDNIKEYVDKINAKRITKVNLKYFQYLAVLFSEIFLYRMRNDKPAFIKDLNDFLEEYKRESQNKTLDSFTEFKEEDLQKIAFYMATGSGKTLIAHINYYQFERYKWFNLNSILFITPNEGMSKQHYEEMQLSGIPCAIYSSEGSLPQDKVIIIEMTKLVDKKEGKGVTVSVDAFDDKNLVFVDEGHKGNVSEEKKWVTLRKKLASHGFTFEYSATFGQVLSESKLDTLQEYAKCIVMDYSYKYFYLDGYGKDFNAVNMDIKKSSKPEEETYKEKVFTNNLLAYYGQLVAFQDNVNMVRIYNIEKPLWIFVGTTVNKGTKEEEKFVSDVLDIVLFLKKAIEDEKWLKENIENVLNDYSEETNNASISYLRSKSMSVDNIVSCIYNDVFYGKGKLDIYDIKKADGELALKIGASNYFGVINIGDKETFKKKLSLYGIDVKDDAISGSLFESIKGNSNINILIGSKKFIEGWDTWRVSSMGLLNIGTGQGPQIIQLFGRGVRLKGKDMSLKRSSETEADEKVSQALQVLETLQIYGIRANYVSIFLNALTKEIDFENIVIPVAFQHEDKWNELYVPVKEGISIKYEKPIFLDMQLDKPIPVHIDLLPTVTLHQSTDEYNNERVVQTKKVAQSNACTLDKNYFTKYEQLIDWDKLYMEMNSFKNSNRYNNLVITKQGLKYVLTSGDHDIVTGEDLSHIKTVEDLRKVEDLALIILRTYADRLHKVLLSNEEGNAMVYKTLKEEESDIKIPFVKADGNSPKYVVKVEKSRGSEKFVKKLTSYLNSPDWFSKLEKNKTLPNVYFDKHLFLPLLIKENSSKFILKTTPDSLVYSEAEFVRQIKTYCEQHPDRFSDVELYVLRLFPSNKIGFSIDWMHFYPDFALWLKNDVKQLVVFVEPHSLAYEDRMGEQKSKVNFRSKIKDLEKLLEQNMEKEARDLKVKLDYFLLSPTLRKNAVVKTAQGTYEQNHILFLEDKQWAEDFFEMIFDEFNQDNKEMNKEENTNENTNP